jgi:hypothetical protein
MFFFHTPLLLYIKIKTLANQSSFKKKGASQVADFSAKLEVG